MDYDPKQLISESFKINGISDEEILPFLGEFIIPIIPLPPLFVTL